MKILSLIGMCLSTFLYTTNLQAADKVDFNRHVRMILADKCYACHGPDAKTVEADLRLDLRDVATKVDEDGDGAIVPGKPEKSSVVERIFSTDESDMMPPPDSHKKLSAEEKKILKQWISEGAEYKKHWAFLKPTRPTAPKVKDSTWAKTDIDRFTLKQLEMKSMKPSPQASRETLMRRVYLDLIGYPPSRKELLDYLADKRPDAYERMVDRVLESPHYGEKMARIWLDLARYGDTNGYHFDSTRSVWLWRDWVIKAYNKNMSFDKFTKWQLAGDLMPNATIEQKIASGFNRNARFNEEGGADPKEWLVRYAVDRTVTVGQVWMGMTLQCAECHSHKYDPISQKEFYQLYAFFNSMEEVGAGGSGGFHRRPVPPVLKIERPEDKKRIAAAKSNIKKIQQQIKQAIAQYKYVEPSAPTKVKLNDIPTDVIWIDDNLPQGAKATGSWAWGNKKKQPVHSGKRSSHRQAKGLTQHYFIDASESFVINQGDKLFAYVWIDPKDKPKMVMLQFYDGAWEHRAYWGEDLSQWGQKDTPSRLRMGDLPEAGKWVRLEVEASKVNLKPGASLTGWAFTQFDGKVYYDTAGLHTKGNAQKNGQQNKSLIAWEKQGANAKGVPGNIRNIAKKPAAKRNAAEQKQLQDYFVENILVDSRKIFAPLQQQLKQAQAELKNAEKAIPLQMVSVELKTPRPAHILIRGNFEKPGEKVEREVPAIFPKFPKGMPRNRLGLANWLVGKNHPTTARVTVNRLWAQLYGRGIVETIGDFGHLGRYPTHPALLDYLADEFVKSGWDTKHMLRLMVNTATYKQSSVNHHRYDAIDKDNLYLWRAPRFRLPAEEIRDSALRTAGMLSPKIGGPPVFPIQPKDYYRGKQGGWRWNVSKGEDRYRRGMYTFWRRTTPYPTFVIFDAPDRSECLVSRARTNTPLQVLALQNDPQFVEAHRVFGQTILTKGPKDLDGKIKYAFQRAVSRTPSKEELDVLKEYYQTELAYYQKNKENAEKVIKAGPYEQIKGLDVAEHAAWMAVANTLMTTDEFLTRE